MIVRSDLAALTPTQRAELIYAQARGELTDRLWRAALGSLDSGDAAASGPSAPRFDLEALVSALTAAAGPGAPPAAAAPPLAPPEAPAAPGAPAPLLPQDFAAPVAAGLSPAALGPNQRHAAAIAAAGARTGLPPAALAAIVDAEAAKRGDGSWNLHSRNPRSSAAGLGQFLSGTWQGEAERPGTYLNRVAHEKGWLDAAGRVTAVARSALLALRYDARSAIEATADYARRNLDRLEQAGVRIGDDVRQIARAAYLGHHLGPGDAVRFLSVGGLPAPRAEKLLAAQIGSSGARARIAAAGEASAAHRDWLLGFVDRHIRPARFAA